MEYPRPQPSKLTLQNSSSGHGKPLNITSGEISSTSSNATFVTVSILFFESGRQQERKAFIKYCVFNLIFSADKFDLMTTSRSPFPMIPAWKTDMALCATIRLFPCNKYLCLKHMASVSQILDCQKKKSKIWPHLFYIFLKQWNTDWTNQIRIRLDCGPKNGRHRRVDSDFN